MINTLIGTQELHHTLHDPDRIVIDCRYDLTDTDAGYTAYKKGHIPGAYYVHLHHDLSGPPKTDNGRHPLPDAMQLNELFSSLGIKSDSQVIVYDSTYGSIAARFWWLLRYMGHEKVAVLNGGWQEWIAAVNEIEIRENIPVKSKFSAKPCKDWLVTLGNVEHVPCLVDSREPERFSGEVEPIDPVAGHIPGAVNYYWKMNLDDDGKFLPAEVIKRALLECYGGKDPADVTFYCGSGVTACHNILAAAHAGLEMPKLYAGSWSEWCNNAELPVATGK